MNSRTKDVVIRKQVKSVTFGFYSDKDVRDRSVVEITSPVSFDPNNAPLPTGLYDPRLGATPRAVPYCPTCALNSHDCPGHFGHIELLVPCYHPVLFSDIVQFLRLKCFQCHRLQANSHQLLLYRVKFHLLRQNRVTELSGLDDKLAGAAAGARDNDRDGDQRGGDPDDSASPRRRSAVGANTAVAMARIGAAGMATVLERYLNEFNEAAAADPGRRQRRPKSSWTSYQRELRKGLAGELVAACKAKSCPHCGAAAPAIRGDAGNKVFLRYSKAAQKMNALEKRGGGTGRRGGMGGGGGGGGATMVESALSAPSRGDARGGYESDDTVPEPMEGDDVDMDDDNESDDDDNDGVDAAGAAGAAGAASGTNKDKYMHPGEVQAQLRRTWDLDPFLCSCLFGFDEDRDSGGNVDDGGATTRGLDKFFVHAVPVPPSRFRPPMQLGTMTVEHSQTQYLGKILQLNALIGTHLAGGSGGGGGDSRGTAATAQSSSSSKVYTTWMELQTTLNCYMDSSKDPSASPNTAPGIRQILERKEGLFRKNMMGKRVDFACRSVISPDPYIGANEIGLPRYFAQVLTYPTPVTDLNAPHMRALVERGVDVYPGARWVEVHGKRVDLTKMTRFKREALAANLLSAAKTGTPAIVGRQLSDGDYVLMNRQPTLHKPGIMAHRVRVLHNPNQKTIRMHYANCNTYNADYDGDELNCHFPQSELARSEAVHIARTDYQYIVPTDGSPLRGLIQDHVVGGVKLTKRDTFLEKWEYQQLIFAALSSLQGLEVVPAGMDIQVVPPAVLKPRELWTGKQVVSTLLLHLCKTNHGDSAHKLNGITLERKAKTPEAAFGPLLEEHLVLIRDGELLRGVLDKAAFGATDFSLVHGVYEAYGPEKAGILLNALGRLFTAYIQYFAGHSCRMEDLVLTKRADQDRRVLVERSYNLGARAAKAWADSDGGKVPIPPVKEQPNSGKALKPDEAMSAAAKIADLLTGTEAKHNHAALDAYMQSQLNPLSSEIVKKCLPGGLSVPFPYNSFSIMTVTGAKGSIVNQSQVSCALGQQALEGRRVPRMSSGRTLPSFAPYDPNPRADGFVMDRFLTGVRPQEYYFHCMAGREGLVDTAVKTSRSGYLQRCLVKHLEELTISYDFTVRNAEGGVIQFLYGEDGLDPTKASYLDCTEKSFDFMARNYGALSSRNSALSNSTIEEAVAVALACESVPKGSIAFPKVEGRVLARRLRFGSAWNRGALCTGWHKATITKVRHNGKSVDLRYDEDGQVVTRVPICCDLSSTEDHCGATDRVLSNLAMIVKPALEDPVMSSRKSEGGVGVNGACVSEKIAMAAHHAMMSDTMRASMSSLGVTRSQLSHLIAAKYSSSLCAPGEAVGCIAAQSVGEPSTQMTLNTFHLAGSGANVTLGIPRLREVIMTAAREPKTPTMSIPLQGHVTEAAALRLTRRLTKLNLMELIASDRGVCVQETIDCVGGTDWMRNYIITIKLHPAERIQEAFGLSIHNVAAVVAKSFVPKLAATMKTELRRSSVETEIIGGQSSDYVSDDSDSMETDGNALLESESRQQANEEEKDDEAPTEEDGMDASRYRQRSDSASYDDDDEAGSDNDNEAEGGETQFRGGSPSNEGFSEMTKVADDGVSPVVNARLNTITLQPLSVDPSSPPLLMVDLVEKAASSTLLRSIKGIHEAYVNNEEGRGRCLQTAGVNFEEVWKLNGVDHERLMSNDVWAICCSYGVEAARSSIVNQVTSVFGAYGIAVDPRHLSLIADYMTYDGGYKPMNRTGMEASSSPFLQMSFETTVNFLKQSAVQGRSDDLSSPSGNIVMGRPVLHGTGAFDLLAGMSQR